MDWATILLAGGTALGGSGSAFLWLETRSDHGRRKRRQEIDNSIGQAISPLQTDLTEIRSKVEHMAPYNAAQLKAAIYEALEPVKDQISILNTKIEPVWKALEQLAINNANVLHHPDPRRAELDELLDHFRDNILTADEEFRLRRYLTRIKNYESGRDIGFPVYEGEPSAAANLLSMLELVRIYRRERTEQS